MFLDIGAGILLALTTAYYTHTDITITWIFFAVLFVLLPDADMVTYVIKKILQKRKTTNHRSWTHYPILYLPIVILLYFISPAYSLLFFLCIYFHFAHDTVWLGWGISWLWPFSDRKFKFFPDKNGVITSEVLITWPRKDEEEIFKKYHNPTWIHDFYCKPNIVAYTEYGVFIFAILTLLYIL